MKALLGWALVLCTLSGCFLKQEPPGGGTNPTTQAAEGLVRVEDMTGDGTGAQLVGLFAPVQSGSGVTVDGARYASIRAEKTRAPSCELIKPKREERAVSLFSVGKLFFGPALSTDGVTISPDKDNQYIASLQAGVAPGIYQVKTEGSKDVAAFGVTLSMPENLKNVQVVAKNDLGEDVPQDPAGLAIKRSADFKITWQDGSFQNTADLSMLEISAKTSAGKYTLNCVGKEQDLGVPGSRAWQLPASIMQRLPASTEAVLYLSRIHVKGYAMSNFTVQMQGFRTYGLLASIVE